ncbi:MAG: hypothetical protein LBD87_06270 [Prevotellaceae bacterium]|jgi:hypothetical protein|nr:hypothetical protein [Prevotellaceae bacterium]
MKTTMKMPGTLRRGFKVAGFFAVLLTALFLSIGMDALAQDTGFTLAASGAAAAIGTHDAGVANKELNTEDAKALSPNILEDSVSEKITEIYSEDAPFFYLLNKFSKVKMNTKHGIFSRVHKFYQIDQRPIQCIVTTGNASATTISTDLEVDNVKMWTKDCVVDVLLSNPTAGQLGYDYDSNQELQIGKLQLIVISVDKGANKITVQALNARRAAIEDADTAYVPVIPAGTRLVRLPMLGSETDAQAPPYADMPTDTKNYVATFHTQYEVTPDFLKHGKEVNWGEAQIKDRNLKDMMRTIERNLIAGQRAHITDVIDGDEKYQMGGFLYFNTNTFEYVINSAGEGLTGDDLNNLMAHTFAGNNGSHSRLLLMGSDFARRAQSIKDTEKWSTVLTPKTKYGFEFTGIANLFGTLDAMLYTTLDDVGMKDYALIIDLANASVVEAEGLCVTPLELKKSGQKNVEASYITRKMTYEHRNPKTHVLVKPKYI